MRAVILAAGRGSRLGQLGEDRPKCLVELEGKPLIERQIAALRRGGVDEIGVVRGYRAEMIGFPGLSYFANQRWAETNMVMSLAAAAAWLHSGPVIVSYADIFYRSDLVRDLAAAPGQLVLSYDRDWRRLWTRRFADPLADAETFRIDAAGQLLEIGGKNTLPAFNDALRGQKVGQELTFEVVYPADFGDRRLAGQTVGYDVTVKAIKRKVYPERDAELAKQLGGNESWEEFAGQLRERAATRKREALEANAKHKMLDELVGRYHFPVPESFVQQRVDARLERGLRALAQQGMTADDMRKLDFGRLRAAQRQEAEREVRASLVVDRIADAEGVVVSDEELDNEVLMLSIQTREPYDAIRDRLAKDGGLGRLREELRREKTSSVLYEKLAS